MKSFSRIHQVLFGRPYVYIMDALPGFVTVEIYALKSNLLA